MKLLHRYVVQERSPRAEARVCMRDECAEPAAYDCIAQFLRPSGAMDPGATARLCSAHALDWLRFSL